MLRGAQKHMIVVRTKDSKMFEEAYFVMRRELPEEGENRSDMLREANRILEGTLRGGQRERHSPLRNILWGSAGLICGLLLGGGGVGLLWFLL